MNYFDTLPSELVSLLVLYEIDIPTRIVLFHTCRRFAMVVGNMHRIRKQRRKFCEITAAKGYLDVLGWMSKVGPPGARLYPLTNRSCVKAATNGDLKMLQWILYNSDTIICSERPSYSPTTYEMHWDPITVERKICRPHKSIYCAASDNNHTHIINWLREYERRSCPSRSCNKELRNACISGDITTLEKYTNYPDDAVYYAAYGNRLEVVLWLVSKGCSNALACQGAAAGGHIKLLMNLRKSNYPWGEVCNNAIGNTQIMAYAKSEGCPWTERSAYIKYRGGCYETIGLIKQKTSREIYNNYNKK